MHSIFKKLWLVIAITVLANAANAQLYPSYSISVTENGTTLNNPWVGGIDLPQFSNFDINADNKNDLIIFDKKAQRWLVFLQDNANQFKHNPIYETRFPTIKNMGLIRDYNCDNIPDVFAHINSGIQVFKGQLDNNNIIYFTLVEDLITYSTGFGNSNLFKFNDDIPAIEDFDNDGDIDILSFGVLGTTVRYYKNLSVEMGYNCDSLIYERNSDCWGNFSESNTDNSLNLGISCKGITLEKTNGNTSRHTGSTLLAFDYENDGDKDLLLGDISFNELIHLTNGGNNQLADITSYQNNFPTSDTSIDISIFPAAFEIDYNNDGLLDLVAAPNSSTFSLNINNVWLYERTNNTNRRFELKTKNYLVDGMIDRGSFSYPVLFDYNADGLQDLIVSNSFEFTSATSASVSNLSLYENTGTATSPQFTLVNEDYLNLSALNLEYIRPAFGDLDGDGDQDLLFGEQSGALHYYENTANAGQTANFVQNTLNYFNLDAGNFSHPVLFDLNQDGLLDIVTGKQAYGAINYYWNFGTANAPLFSSDSVNTQLGNIQVTEPGFLIGYSAPNISTQNDSILLWVGSEPGNIHQYLVNKDSLKNGSFNTITDSLGNRTLGLRTTIFTNDINNDGFTDFFIGNSRGGVEFYSEKNIDNIQFPPVSIAHLTPVNFSIFPNPTKHQLNINAQTAITSIKIVNQLGQTISSHFFKTGKNKHNISTTHLQNGIYYLVVNNQHAKPFVKH